MVYRDVVDRAEQQVSVGVAVDLSLPLEDHRLVVQGLDDLGLLLQRTGGRQAAVVPGFRWKREENDMVTFDITTVTVKVVKL